MSSVVVSKELRPCIISLPKSGFDERALFHQWHTVTEGEKSILYGLVEYGNGKLEFVRPKYMKFVDKKLYDYIWEEGVVRQ